MTMHVETIIFHSLREAAKRVLTRLRTALAVCIALLSLGHTGFAASPKDVSAPQYPIEVLFAPVGGIKPKLANLIQNAQESILIATYNIFLPDVTLSLVGANYRGVDVRIILDNYGPTIEKSDFPLFKRNSIPLIMMGGLVDQGAMNHSFAIFDKKLVTIGSYRWTEAGENGDYSSMVFTSDPETVNTYVRKFEQLWTGK